MAFAFPYCLAFCIILSFEFIPKETGVVIKKYTPSFFVLSFLLLFIGFRGFIVTDWVSYYPYFEEEVPTFFDNERIGKFLNGWPWEKAFLVYSVMMKTICKNYFFFQFFSFLFDLVVIHITFSRYIQRKYFPLAYAIFFIFQGFVIEVNLLRNSKAIMLFLLSIPYLQKRNFLKYVLLNILAGMFHVSGFLYIPLYFFIGRVFNRKLILMLFFVGNIFFFSKIKIISFVISFIAPFMAGSRFGTMISAYGLISNKFASYSIGVGFLERTFTFFLLLHFQNKLIKMDNKFIPFINLLYMFLFGYLYLAEVGILIERITLLFVVGYWIVFPAIYSLLKKNKKKLFIFFVVIYGMLKMIVQCDEPNYSYTNLLYEIPDYSERLKLIKAGDKK